MRVDGVRLFDAVQATWNLLEPSAGSTLAAAPAGMGVIVKEALANGRLTARNEEPDFARQRVARGAMAATPWYDDRRAGDSRRGAALVDVVLSGAAAVNHLESNLVALAVPWNEEAAALLEALAEPATLYWERHAHGLELRKKMASLTETVRALPVPRSTGRPPFWITTGGRGTNTKACGSRTARAMALRALAKRLHAERWAQRGRGRWRSTLADPARLPRLRGAAL